MGSARNANLKKGEETLLLHLISDTANTALIGRRFGVIIAHFLKLPCTVLSKKLKQGQTTKLNACAKYKRVGRNLTEVIASDVDDRLGRPGPGARQVSRFGVDLPVVIGSKYEMVVRVPYEAPVGCVFYSYHMKSNRF